MSARRIKGNPLRAVGKLWVRLWPDVLSVDPSMLPVVGAVLY